MVLLAPDSRKGPLPGLQRSHPGAPLLCRRLARLRRLALPIDGRRNSSEGGGGLQLQARYLDACPALGTLLASRQQRWGDVVGDHSAVPRVLRDHAQQDRLSVLLVCRPTRQLSQMIARAVLCCQRGVRPRRLTAERNYDVSIVCKLEGGEEGSANVVHRETTDRLGEGHRRICAPRSLYHATDDLFAIKVDIKCAAPLLLFKLRLQASLITQKFVKAGPWQYMAD